MSRNRKTKSRNNQKRNRRRRARKNFNQPEKASLTVVKDFGQEDSNGVYNFYNLSLSQFPRAVAVAKAYREFRITGVTVRFKPWYDTYVNWTGNASSLPYLLHIIDKTRTFSDIRTRTDFLNAGAKSLRFDDKTMIVKYKPAVMIAGAEQDPVVATFSKPLISPWLSTNDNMSRPNLSVPWHPSAVEHNGIVYTVNQDSGQGAPPVIYSVEVSVEFEFRGTSFDTPVSTSEPAKDIRSHTHEV